MKSTIALLSIVTCALSLGACSTASEGTKKVTLTSCTPGDPGKTVFLEKNSYAPEGRVVRLAPR